jgi:hypothetical protein
MEFQTPAGRKRSKELTKQIIVAYLLKVRTVEPEKEPLLSYVGLLPCASTICRAATVIIIAAAKGEAQ